MKVIIALLTVAFGSTLSADNVPFRCSLEITGRQNEDGIGTLVQLKGENILATVVEFLDGGKWVKVRTLDRPAKFEIRHRSRILDFHGRPIHEYNVRH